MSGFSDVLLDILLRINISGVNPRSKLEEKIDI